MKLVAFGARRMEMGVEDGLFVLFLFVTNLVEFFESLNLSIKTKKENGKDGERVKNIHRNFDR